MKTADVYHYANAKRFLKCRSVSSDQHIRSVFGIPSGVGHVISVNQSLLTVSFLTNRFIIAVLLLTYRPINVKPAVGGGGA